MLYGKKGFERIIWAFKNVLNHTVTWLFHDLEGANDGTGPIGAFKPIVRETAPAIEILDKISVPELPKPFDSDDELEAAELLEWLSLVFSSSPRAKDDDAVDAFLSRYKIPEFSSDVLGMPPSKQQDLTKFHWYGFLPPAFIMKVLLATLRAANDAEEEEHWCALSAVAFGGEAYTVMRTKDRFMTWDYVD